uniref:Si:ch211-271g18.3 n=1 Tax=Nothobranchius kuhntae TaxID=321403 RepID=A0A1A8IK22_NOTKU
MFSDDLHTRSHRSAFTVTPKHICSDAQVCFGKRSGFGKLVSSGLTTRESGRAERTPRGTEPPALFSPPRYSCQARQNSEMQPLTQTRPESLISELI